jgi:hypothetical protein
LKLLKGNRLDPVIVGCRIRRGERRRRVRSGAVLCGRPCVFAMALQSRCTATVGWSTSVRSAVEWLREGSSVGNNWVFRPWQMPSERTEACQARQRAAARSRLHAVLTGGGRRRQLAVCVDLLLSQAVCPDVSFADVDEMVSIAPSWNTDQGV